MSTCFQIGLRQTTGASTHTEWVNVHLSIWFSSAASVSVSQTEWVSCVSDEEDILVYERPPAVVVETDDLEGRSWAYTPRDCHCLGQQGGSRKIWGGIFFFFFKRAGCGVEWIGILRHYILFQLPTAHQSDECYVLACAYPRAHCGLF